MSQFKCKLKIPGTCEMVLIPGYNSMAAATITAAIGTTRREVKWRQLGSLRDRPSLTARLPAAVDQLPFPLLCPCLLTPGSSNDTIRTQHRFTRHEHILAIRLCDHHTNAVNETSLIKSIDLVMSLCLELPPVAGPFRPRSWRTSLGDSSINHTISCLRNYQGTSHIVELSAFRVTWFDYA